MMVRNEEMNRQDQTKIVCPASGAVARGFIDQLKRTNAIQPERAKAVSAAVDKAESLRSGKDKSAALDQLDALAKEIESSASGPTGRDADRLKSLAATINPPPAKLP